jgi:hypothetical protein
MRGYISEITMRGDGSKRDVKFTKAIKNAEFSRTTASAERVCAGLRFTVNSPFNPSEVPCTDFRVEPRPDGGFAISCESAIFERVETSHHAGMIINARICRSENAIGALARAITIEEQEANHPWKFHVIVEDVKTTFRADLEPLREHNDPKPYGAHTLEEAEFCAHVFEQDCLSKYS